MYRYDNPMPELTLCPSQRSVNSANRQAVVPGHLSLNVLFWLASIFKGTVWICMRVLPLDRPWKGDPPLKVFNFLNFDLEYLIRVQSSEPLHAKMNPTCYRTCLDHSLHVLKPWSFPPNCTPKMPERHQLFFEYGWWVKNSNILLSKPK